MDSSDIDTAYDSLERLNNAVEENSRLTGKQNRIMIVLTVTIVVMTAVMIVLMIVQIGSKLLLCPQP